MDSAIKTFIASFSSPLAQNQCIKSKDLDSSPLDELSYRSGLISDDVGSECKKKIEAFKTILISKEGEDPFEGLAIIDAIQRLGIEYHFQSEIDSILLNQYMNLIHNKHNANELHEVALQFRLFRQEGYYVPSGVFNNFKDEKGNFEEKLSDKGLMSLYEASQLSIEGEDILDESRDYSCQVLQSRMMLLLDHPQSKAIENTLKHPHYKSLAKFMAKKFIKNIHGQNGWMSELYEIAMLDFKMAQFQHQREIVQVVEWWKELGLSEELKFARDQPVKWYTWCMTGLTDPSLSEQRMDLIKPISFVYLIDDIFDVHGTLDDLILFTQIVNRWDIEAIEQLPDYMRSCFKALDNITDEVSYKVYRQHGWNPLDSLRKAWGSLCNAFLVEARWFASGELPNADEYLQNGIVSSGVHVVLVHLFFLLGEGITKENVELIDGNPYIISSTAKILRLWDDLGSAKDENQDGHDGSYLECYMKEHRESSVESARNHVLETISEAWKRLNQECLSDNTFSPTFTKACLNVARMVPLMYSYDENCRLPILEEHINFVLREDASM